MSEYLEEAVWREHYRDLVAGGRMIREAVDEAFGPAAPLQPTEYTASGIQECEHLAVAIVLYADKMKRHIAELETECAGLKEQIALTSRMSVEKIIDEVPPIACD
jgi:hypothetical protein